MEHLWVQKTDSSPSNWWILTDFLLIKFQCLVQDGAPSRARALSCRLMLNSIFLAFFWTLFLGKTKDGKTQPLLVRQCQIPLFSAKIPVFLAKKKKTCLVHFLGWTTPFLRENQRLASSSTASSKGSAAKPASCCCNLGMVSDQGPMKVEFYTINVDTLG